MVAVRQVVVDVKKKFAALGDGEQVAVQLDPPNLTTTARRAEGSASAVLSSVATLTSL